MSVPSLALVPLAIFAAACGVTQKPSAVPRTTSTTGNGLCCSGGGGRIRHPIERPSRWSGSDSRDQGISTRFEGIRIGMHNSARSRMLWVAVTSWHFNHLTLSNQAGNGSMPFVVHSSAGTAPYSETTAPCSGECVIVATTGNPVGTPAHGVYYMAPITFAAG